MSWFEKQIEERRAADQQALEDSFARAAGVVLGQRSAEKVSDARIVTKNAIDEILKAYHYKPIELPESLQDADTQMEYCLTAPSCSATVLPPASLWPHAAYGGADG